VQNNGYFDRFCCHNGKLWGDVIISSVEMQKKTVSKYLSRQSFVSFYGKFKNSTLFVLLLRYRLNLEEYEFRNL